MRSANSYQDIKTPEEERFDYEVKAYVNDMIEDFVEHTGHRPDIYTIGQMRRRAMKELTEMEEEDDD